MRAKKIGQPHLRDYIKGSGIAHPTQLHKTFTHKKRVEKERQQKKAKYASIKQRKAILALSCLIIYILFHPLKGAMSHNTHARANENKIEKDGPTFSSCVGDFGRLFYLSKSQPSLDS